MESTDIKQWSVQNGISTPVNPHETATEGDYYRRKSEGVSWGDFLHKQWIDFESWKLNNTFPTDAPDGVYDTDRFGEVTEQLFNEIQDKWINKQLNTGYSFIGSKTRKFLPFIHQEHPAGIKPQFGERFVIYDEGTPLLQFESEVHIKDTENEECIIIVKSGYSDLQPTKDIAHNILKILNNGNSTKSS